MADKNDGGDKTEQPTPKRLRDARKKGQVWKSREISSTATLLVWLVLAGLVAGYGAWRIVALMQAGLGTLDADFATSARNLG